MMEISPRLVVPCEDIIVGKYQHTVAVDCFNHEPGGCVFNRIDEIRAHCVVRYHCTTIGEQGVGTCVFGDGDTHFHSKFYECGICNFYRSSYWSFLTFVAGRGAKRP